MSSLIQFALLGLGTGATYTLLGCGVLLIHRGSAVVNFAQAAMAMLGALVFVTLHDQQELPAVLAFALSAAALAVVGAVFFMAVMNPLGSEAPFARTIATLALLILIQGSASVIWGTQALFVDSLLPSNLITVAEVSITVDRLLLVGVACAITLALWFSGRFTAMGLALRGLSENRRATAALGWSAVSLGTITWAGGAALAASAGIFIAPLSGIDVNSMPLLIIPVLAAALLANFQSFPILLAASLGIGVSQSLIANYVGLKGLEQIVPFAVIIVFLVLRGSKVVERSTISETFPALGRGTVSWPWLSAMAVIVIVCLNLTDNADLFHAFTVTLAWGLIALSVVVIMGYTGQLSLAQVTLGGIAALTAARLVTDLQVSFALALIVAVAAATVVGLVFAIPALRTRGINLAIVTLGLASVTSTLVFSNQWFVGPFGSIAIPSPTILGVDVGTLLYPRRYAIVVFLLFVLTSLTVAAVRRGTAGGRLIAVRTNERAAAALGVNVRGAKLYAFAFGAAIAGLGGALLAFNNAAVDVTGFSAIQSVYAIAYAMAGGVGYVVGAAGGATLGAGALGTWILNLFAPDANPMWLQIIGGLVLLLFIRFQPSGMAQGWTRLGEGVQRATSRLRPGRERRPAHEVHALDELRDLRVHATGLETRNLQVQFGAVAAVADVSFAVEPGEVVALIGPNGAGKSTTIDAISGFIRSRGKVLVDGRDVSQSAAYRRSRLGLVRSFQSLELFESLTVMDNLLVGADDGLTRAYLRDLVRPRLPVLTPMASLAIHEFDLEDVLGLRVDELSYGKRRLVAIARAIASSPSVLLLDEPAAGLSDVETHEFKRVINVLAARGMSILLVEHDMDLVMDVSHRIVVLDAGRHLATGTPQEIRQNPAVRSAYLGGDDTTDQLTSTTEAEGVRS